MEHIKNKAIRLIDYLTELALLRSKGKGSSLPLTLANFADDLGDALDKLDKTAGGEIYELIWDVHRIIGLQFSRGNRTGRKEIEYVPETQ